MKRQRSLPPEIRDWVEIVVEDNAVDLLRYFERRVSHPEDAADLLGQVFLVLWEKGARIPTTDEDSRMWCFGIARNVLREHRRRATKTLDLATALRNHLRDAQPPVISADVAAETRMRAEDVRRALTLLDERAKELLMLIYWDGFSVADAARLLSVNESTARTRHVRALRRLEATLESDEHRFAAPRSTAVRNARSSQQLRT